MGVEDKLIANWVYVNPGKTTHLGTWLCKYGSSLALRPAEHLPISFKILNTSVAGLSYPRRTAVRLGALSGALYDALDRSQVWNYGCPLHVAGSNSLG